MTGWDLAHCIEVICRLEKTCPGETRVHPLGETSICDAPYTCELCQGHGSVPVLSTLREKCTTCLGSLKYTAVYLGDGAIHEYRCYDCNNNGYLPKVDLERLLEAIKLDGQYQVKMCVAGWHSTYVTLRDLKGRLHGDGIGPGEILALCRAVCAAYKGD